MKKYKDDGSDIVLAIVTSWYMDKAGIQRLYNSCNMEDPYSPQYFIGINGVYKFFKFRDKPTPPYSTDGSAEWLQEQPKTVVVNFAGTQVEKRTKYIDKCEELGVDVAIVIDSDEFFDKNYRDWKTFREWLVKYIRSYDPEGYGVIFALLQWIDKDYVKAYNSMEVDQWSVHPRIWHRPEKLEYYNNVHYWVRRKGTSNPGERIASTNITIEHGVRMGTDSKLRSPEFLDARDEWAKLGIYDEDKHIKKYNTSHGLPYRSIPNLIFGKPNEIRSLNPLLAIVTNHYEQHIITDFKGIVNVDKIYLDGFEHMHEALNRATAFFIEHVEYSHLIITSDKYHITRTDVNKLFPNLTKNYDVIAGYSKGDIMYSFSTKTFDWRDNDLRYQMRNESIDPDDNNLWNVTYTDFILLAIARRCLYRLQFEKDYEKLFCWDVTHKDYKIFVDPQIRIGYPIYNLERQFYTNPTLLFERRMLDIDMFMA